MSYDEEKKALLQETRVLKTSVKGRVSASRGSPPVLFREAGTPIPFCRKGQWSTAFSTIASFRRQCHACCTNEVKPQKQKIMQALKKLGLPTDVPVRVLLSETFNSSICELSNEQKEIIGILRDVVASYNKTTPSQTKITCSRDAADVVRARLVALNHEQTWAIFLNADNSTIETSMMCKGSLDFTPIDSRRIIAKALALNAKSIILIHNHPSGNPLPSKSDISGTEKLRDAGKLMDISLLDHIIISDGKYYSFSDEDVSVL